MASIIISDEEYKNLTVGATAKIHFIHSNYEMIIYFFGENFVLSRDKRATPSGIETVNILISDIEAAECRLWLDETLKRLQEEEWQKIKAATAAELGVEPLRVTAERHKAGKNK